MDEVEDVDVGVDVELGNTVGGGEELMGSVCNWNRIFRTSKGATKKREMPA